eukprot:XP_011682111.1 PREDICTED: muscarinic acetylcholine receptor M1-like [Strongylocentrotus purpuratus]
MEIPDNFSLTDRACQTSYNLSDCNTQYRHEPQISATFLLLLLVSTLTVFTNALILAAFRVEKKLRTYILNIAIADFLVGLIVMPLRSTIFLYDSWAFGRIPSILFIGFQNSILSVSVCGVVVICIDRYIATFYPIKHFQKKSIRKATTINIGTWIISFGVWMMISSVWDFIEPQNLKIASGFWRANYTLNDGVVIVVSVLRLPLPFIIIAGFYVRIYFRVRNIGRKHVSAGLKKLPFRRHCGRPVCQSQDVASREEVTSGSAKEESVLFDQLKESITVPSISFKIISHDEQNRKERGSVKSDRDRPDGHNPPLPNRMTRNYRGRQGGSSKESQKALRTLTFIILAFVLTWLPNIVNLINFISSADNFINLNDDYREITRWISYSNSLINPMAYAMAQPLIRQTILKILRCRK